MLTLLTAILVISSVIALSFSTTPTTLDFSQSQLTQDITLTNNNASQLLNLGFSIGSINDGQGHLVTFKPISSINNLNGSTTKTIEINTPDSEIEIGRYSTMLNITNTNDNSDIQEVTVYYQQSYCESGQKNVTDLYIRSVDFSGSSDEDDDDTWYPQDEITMDIDVKNSADDDLDATIEWDIYDKEEKEWLDIGDDKDLSVNKGNTETETFVFIVPSDFVKSTNKYVLYIKVYEEGEEESICGSVSDNRKSNQITDEEGIPIEIQRETNQVVVSKYLLPEILSCGESGDVDLWIANIGRQKEDKIQVVLESSDINSEITKTITKLNEDDKAEKITFPITIPEDAEEKDYSLKFKIHYEYDDHDDVYDTVDIYSIPDKITIAGSCLSGKDVSISAFLESAEAVEGQEIIISATVTNTGTSSTQYTFISEGYESWAEEKEVSNRLFTLAPAESKVITLTYNLKQGSAGDHTFTLKALYGTESKEQPLSITVSESKGALSGFSDLFQGNWFIWAIIAVNVVLVVIIILVIIRVSRE